VATPQQTLDFFTRANTLMDSILWYSTHVIKQNNRTCCNKIEKKMGLTSDFLSRRGMRHYAKKVIHEYFAG
jgi:hypothetical protein